MRKFVFIASLFIISTLTSCKGLMDRKLDKDDIKEVVQQIAKCDTLGLNEKGYIVKKIVSDAKYATEHRKDLKEAKTWRRKEYLEAKIKNTLTNREAIAKHSSYFRMRRQEQLNKIENNKKLSTLMTPKEVDYKFKLVEKFRHWYRYSADVTIYFDFNNLFGDDLKKINFSCQIVPSNARKDEGGGYGGYLYGSATFSREDTDFKHRYGIIYSVGSNVGTEMHKYYNRRKKKPNSDLILLKDCSYNIHYVELENGTRISYKNPLKKWLEPGDIK